MGCGGLPGGPACRGQDLWQGGTGQSLRGWGLVPCRWVGLHDGAGAASWGWELALADRLAPAPDGSLCGRTLAPSWPFH